MSLFGLVPGRPCGLVRQHRSQHGPALHFELHVNSRPVDPLKADISTASRVLEEEMTVFTQRVATLDAAMQVNQTDLTSRSSPKANSEGI